MVDFSIMENINELCVIEGYFCKNLVFKFISSTFSCTLENIKYTLNKGLNIEDNIVVSYVVKKSQ